MSGFSLSNFLESKLIHFDFLIISNSWYTNFSINIVWFFFNKTDFLTFVLRSTNLILISPSIRNINSNVSL